MNGVPAWFQVACALALGVLILVGLYLTREDR